MENQQFVQEYQMDIMEYIKVIMKRKKLIVSIFIAAVAIAVIVNLRLPKIYEINYSIQLGSFNEPLIKNADAKEIILNQNSLSSLINDLNLKMEVGDLRKNIKIADTGSASLLRITITYPDVDMALKISEVLVAPLITQGQNIYKERATVLSQRLRELDSEIKNSEQNITWLQALNSKLSNTKLIAQPDTSLKIILLQNTLPAVESNLSAFRNKRDELKLLLDSSKDFKVFEEPIKPKYPLATNKRKNVIVAGIMSFIFGISLAFFLEFLQKNKEVKAKSE